VAQILDGNLADGLGIALERDLLVIDPRCPVGAGDIVEFNPPPGAQGNS